MKAQQGKMFRMAGCFWDTAHQPKGERGPVFITHRRARAKKALKALDHRSARRAERQTREREGEA